MKKSLYQIPVGDMFTTPKGKTVFVVVRHSFGQTIYRKNITGAPERSAPPLFTVFHINHNG